MMLSSQYSWVLAVTPVLALNWHSQTTPYLTWVDGKTARVNLKIFSLVEQSKVSLSVDLEQTRRSWPNLASSLNQLTLATCLTDGCARVSVGKGIPPVCSPRWWQTLRIPWSNFYRKPLPQRLASAPTFTSYGLFQKLLRQKRMRNKKNFVTTSPRHCRKRRLCVQLFEIHTREDEKKKMRNGKSDRSFSSGNSLPSIKPIDPITFLGHELLLQQNHISAIWECVVSLEARLRSGCGVIYFFLPFANLFDMMLRFCSVNATGVKNLTQVRWKVSHQPFTQEYFEHVVCKSIGKFSIGAQAPWIKATQGVVGRRWSGEP